MTSTVRALSPARIDRILDNGTESSCRLLVDEALGMLTCYTDLTLDQTPMGWTDPGVTYR